MMVPAQLYQLPSGIPFNLELYRLVVLITLAFWFISMLINPELKRVKSGMDSTLIAFGLVVLVSFLVNFPDLIKADNASAEFKALLIVAAYLLMYAFVVSTHLSRGSIDKSLKFIVVLAAILGIFGLIERMTLFNVFRHLHEFIPVLRANNSPYWDIMMRGELRASGSVSHPIAFGMLLALVMPFGYYYATTAKEWRSKLFYALCFCLIIIGSMTSLSRTTFVVLIAAGLVLFIGRPKERVRLTLAGLMMAVVIHFALPGALGTIQTYLSPKYLASNEIGNNNGRVSDYPIVWSKFQQKPFIGGGFASFRPAAFIFLDNQYLGVSLDLGLLGLISFICIFIVSLVKLVRAWMRASNTDRNLIASFAASIVIFMVGSATYDTLGFPQPTFLFFLLLALAFAHVNMTQEEPLIQKEASLGRLHYSSKNSVLSLNPQGQ
jgi:O-antigen ligase